MRNFWENLKNRAAFWMQGRYGTDELNNMLYIAFIVLWFVTLITKKQVFYWIGLAGLGFSLYRTFSRDHLKRSNERLWFLKKIDTGRRYLKLWKLRWEQRKTHRIFLCKNCGAMVRVPKGQGQIQITCPKCRNTFIDRT